MERANVLFEFDLNEYSVLVALLVDGNDFCGDRSHLHHFLRLTSPEMGDALKELQARTVIRGGERVEDTRACRRRCLALSPRRIALAPRSSKPVHRFAGARRFLARPERRSRRQATTEISLIPPLRDSLILYKVLPAITLEGDANGAPHPSQFLCQEILGQIREPNHHGRHRSQSASGSPAALCPSCGRRRRLLIDVRPLRTPYNRYTSIFSSSDDTDRD
jgi:hypothetical protein